MLYQLFQLIQQNGVLALEPHFEHPAESAIFQKYPMFLGRHHRLASLPTR